MCMYAYIYHHSPPKDSLQRPSAEDTVSLLGDVQASTSADGFN